ncbi:ATP-dependent DNA helicase pfh1 [Hypsizygus marmoreus]|uniref:ATP-dependent DNA helicase n=1 Tax=Hypsizygus marmoreus TaxID=39966 RepID=A0A369K100_HYPMA|nr:ATP-dependent DNA helicase pfh1 [Hypsizygus marmoreus]
MSNFQPTRLSRAVEVLTMSVLLDIIQHHVRIPWQAKRSKARLLPFLAACPASVQDEVISVSSSPRNFRTRQIASQNHPDRRRERQNPAEQVQQGLFFEGPPDAWPATLNIYYTEVFVDDVDVDFMRTPSDDIRNSCLSDYIDQTTNEALRQSVCTVCARLLPAAEIVERTLVNVPNRDLLKPQKSHPRHDLTEGLLLCKAGLSSPGMGNVCEECHRKLDKGKRPPLSLSNHMWIGDVPHELKVLTLPERLLIAKYLPAAYVVKMYPKAEGANAWDRRTLNNAMKGNVSTYRLNPEDVVHFMAGNEMPPPPEVLAATIAVTIVGKGGKCEASLPRCFRVKRGRVHAALLWLKAHNPLYASMVISEDRLALLPDNGVPDAITHAVRYSDDEELLEEERNGYVPCQEDEEADIGEHEDVNAAGMMDIEHAMDEDDAEFEDAFDARAFPMHSLGVVDVSGTNVPDADIVAHGLSNLTGDQAADLVIRRSSAFVNEYARQDKLTGQRTDGGPDDTNHLLGCFPVLFPYGQGGFEVDRLENVPYEKHAAWALQYFDKRFRKDPHFMFLVFGVIQKRQVCRATSLQMGKSTFIRNERLLSEVTPGDLKKASAEESQRVPFSNPAVQALRTNVTSVRSKVQGTDESRQSIRSKIWSNTVKFNPPSIWLTLNPSDTHSPIAQVFVGEEIDLKDFDPADPPNSKQRAMNIAEDPFGAAEFFHNTIRWLLTTLFRITGATGNKHVQRREGILGTVNAYIGTVEAQGRGTLHLHMILWLKGAPSANVMRTALQSEAFRLRIADYIKNTIRADLGGATGPEVLAMEKVPAVSYRMPLDPRTPNYAAESTRRERLLARSLQLHTCDRFRCRTVKNGRVQCKRRAPFDLSAHDYINPDGSWFVKRTFGYLNNWNPVLLQAMLCNHDIKLLTNGNDTKDISFYITNYTAKKQVNTSNSSALIAKQLAFLIRKERRNGDIVDINRKLLCRCANTLSREHEFSAPEVASYIMGWGDRYLSHQYVPIYWDAATTALRATFPQHFTVEEVDGDDDEDSPHEELVTVRMVEGRIQLRDQLKEYAQRGEALQHYTFLSFFADTYDAGVINSPEDVDRPGPGRPQNSRFPYLPNSGRDGRCRVVRSTGHEMVPEIIGKWFPRGDDPATADFFSACMLLLLSPWRSLNDLAGEGESFTNKRRRVLDDDVEAARIMDNIQYYYDCSDAATKKRNNARNDIGEQPPFLTSSDTQTHVNEDDQPPPSEDGEGECLLTEEHVEMALRRSWPLREIRFGQAAMEIAEEAKIFDFEGINRAPLKPGVSCASWADRPQFAAWEEMVQAITRSPDRPSGPRQQTAAASNEVAPVNEDSFYLAPPDVPSPDVSFLTVDQRRAHNIIDNHLKAHLAQESPRQLLMIVQGQGGTGKSTLISQITKSFEHRRASHLLARTATTGVAASLIEGQTLHSWAGIPRSGGLKAPSKTTRDKRMKNIGCTRYLIIDEFSMLMKDILCMLSQILGEHFNDEDYASTTTPFGNVNIILCGDPHQFPPVRTAKAALYSKQHSSKNHVVGRHLYEQFDTVVNLSQQLRITDPRWMELLTRLRTGDCTEADLMLVRSLIVTDPNCDLPSFKESPWADAVLITSRHGVREQWNLAALTRHCLRTGHQAYRFFAEDTIHGSVFAPTMQQRVDIAGMRVKETANLNADVHLALGMNIMVTFNIATEADLANGTRAIVENIVLDPRDQFVQPDQVSGVITLRHPPAMVTIRPCRGTFPSIPGMESGILPVFPSEGNFTLQAGNGQITKLKRRQLAITGAYAFTDYKSQGQTLEYVIVDLGKPPGGCLSPFNAYVALSRSRGTNTIRLLRDFEETMFTRHPSEALELDDERLEGLQRLTRHKYGEEGTTWCSL